MKKFNINQVVKVHPKNDNDSYDSFREDDLRIVGISRDNSEHPGFDSSMIGVDYLYELYNITKKEPVYCSLYGYELQLKY